MLSFQFLSTHPPGDVFDGDFLRALGGYSIFETPSRHYSQALAHDHLDRLLHVDVELRWPTTISEGHLHVGTGRDPDEDFRFLTVLWRSSPGESPPA